MSTHSIQFKKGDFAKCPDGAIAVILTHCAHHSQYLVHRLGQGPSLGPDGSRALYCPNDLIPLGHYDGLVIAEAYNLGQKESMNSQANITRPMCIPVEDPDDPPAVLEAKGFDSTPPTRVGAIVHEHRFSDNSLHRTLLVTGVFWHKERGGWLVEYRETGGEYSYRVYSDPQKP